MKQVRIKAQLNAIICSEKTTDLCSRGIESSFHNSSQNATTHYWLVGHDIIDVL